MKKSICAAFAAASTSSSVASDLQYLMFYLTVPLKSQVSCRTMPKSFLSRVLV